MCGIHYLTIGYIPNGCKSERIFCGDPTESDTMEVSLMIEDDKITSIDTDQVIEVNPVDFLNEKSKLWKLMVDTFCTDFTEKAIKPDRIGACWAIFMNEMPSKKGITMLANENDGGEFHNRGGCKNGTFYLRYQLEEDGEYFGEQVLGFI